MRKSKIRLALIAGGVSSERDVSLSGALEVEKALDKSRYEVHRYDPKYDLKKLVSESSMLDAAFILLHGRYGEDGTIQGMLDLLGVPYQGSGVLGSSLAMDKHLSKVVYRAAGMDTPDWVLLDGKAELCAKHLVHRLGLPAIVKPACQGSSVGMTKVNDVDELEPAVEQAFKYDSRVIVEQFISGRELTSGVIGLSDLQALPIVEICPREGHLFFDTEAKYKVGECDEICPAEIEESTAEKAKSIGVMAHKALNLRGYSRTDLILSDSGRLYVLETNTIPGMTPTSLLPLAAEKAGISFSRLLDMLIEFALTDDRYPLRKGV